MPQIIYVTTKLVLTDGCDPQDVVAECDYNFQDEAGRILRTEIIDIDERACND